MAQSGIFHTSMRGFNKNEVLQYIEELNVRMTAEQQAGEETIARLQQEVSDLRTKLSETTEALSHAEENASELQQLVDQYRRTVQELGDCAEQVNTLNREKLALNAQRVRAEQTVQEQALQIEGLRNTVAQWHDELDALKEENAAVNARLKEQAAVEEQRRQYLQIESHYRQLLAENRRYRALIGHVGTFVAEVRQMNQGILDASCDRELEALDMVDERLSSLAAQLDAERQGLAAMKMALIERKETTDNRLNAMMDQLEQNARPENPMEAGE